MKLRSFTRISAMAGLLSIAFTAGVWADTVVQRVDAYLRPDITVKVSGETIRLAEQPPLIYNNNSYLPLRALGEAMNVDIAWEDATQTIYVNPRIYTTQPSVDDSAAHEEIRLQDPMGFEITYLGRKYPVLGNMYEMVEYYRLSDIQRMGVNTDGLRKAKEKLTGDYYIRKTELANAWVVQPTIDYANGPIVIGETNEQKIEALVNYDPLEYSRDDPNYVVGGAILFCFDPGDKPDEFIGIGMKRGEFFKFIYQLKQREEDKFENNMWIKETVWFVNQYTQWKIDTAVPIDPFNR